MCHVQPITGQPYRVPCAAVSHVIVGSPLVNERPKKPCSHQTENKHFTHARTGDILLRLNTRHSDSYYLRLRVWQSDFYSFSHFDYINFMVSTSPFSIAYLSIIGTLSIERNANTFEKSMAILPLLSYCRYHCHRYPSQYKLSVPSTFSICD